METNLNLILDPWISVQRRSGQIETIAPFKITDQMDSNPVIKLCAPRPDFNGALIQFLIGLFQTAMAPENEKEWRGRFSAPPSPEELRKQLEPLAHAFNLLGEGPRFMQDMGLSANDQIPINSILMDTNEAFFSKPVKTGQFCPACASMALIAIQQNAAAVGRGHRVSLRGSGPVTTLAEDVDAPLWQNVWINLLNKHQLRLPKASNGLTDPFLWMDPEKYEHLRKREGVTPADISPLHCFWSQPIRLQLEAPAADAQAQCHICSESRVLMATIRRKSYGIQYETALWQHPLSPAKADDAGNFTPFRMKPDMILYSSWPNLLIENERSRPAKCVATVANERGGIGQNIRIFGYDVKDGQAKVRCWYESIEPLYSIPEEDVPRIRVAIFSLVEKSNQLNYILLGAVEKAMFGTFDKERNRWTFPKAHSSDKWRKGIGSSIAKAFRDSTKELFFSLVSNIVTGKEVEWKQWFESTRKIALEEFDRRMGAGGFEFERLQQHAAARRSLIKELYSKKNQEPSHV